MIKGKNGIYARVLAHSISPAGINLITMEVAYPRIILAELNTHGMICKNSSSSRAIPFNKMKEQLTGKPVRFGQANPGMQDKGEDFDASVGYWSEPDYFGDVHFFGYGDHRNHPNYPPEGAWETAKKHAVEASEYFFKAGYHKQVYNRLTEPFQMMKTVLSWTEGANFFWLRNHDAADPTLQELARVMYEAAKQSEPMLLHPGEWHLPYVDCDRDECGNIYYWCNPGEFLTLDQAIRVSVARTAAVSFRNVDYGVEKSEEVFQKLTSDARIHGSAMAHQATPMKPHKIGSFHRDDKDINFPANSITWEPGITHCARGGELWSAQFRGWIQYRKLIEGENKPGFI